MLPSTQLRDQATTDYAPVTQLSPAAVGRLRSEAEPAGVSRQDASGAAVVAGATPRRLPIGPWMKALGGIGYLCGSIGAGYFARQMGYDWGLTVSIAVLVGTAGASVGMMLPLLLRAIYWTVVAALLGVTGAAALYLLLRLAPAFVDRILGLLGITP